MANNNPTIKQIQVTDTDIRDIDSFKSCIAEVISKVSNTITAKLDGFVLNKMADTTSQILLLYTGSSIITTKVTSDITLVINGISGTLKLKNPGSGWDTQLINNSYYILKLNKQNNTNTWVVKSLSDLILSQIDKTLWQKAISSGKTEPTGGEDGDIYIQYE